MSPIKHDILVYTILLLDFVRSSDENKTSKIPEPKILRGTKCQPLHYTRIVSFRSKYGHHFCAGSLINSHWVLTAAHCLGKPFTVAVGVTEYGDDTRVEVTKTYRHHLYKSDPLQNDIAMVKLKKEIQETRYIKYVNLPKKRMNSEIIQDCSEALVSGWGYISTINKTLPEELQCVKIPVITKEQCKKSYGRLSSKVMCAYSEAGKDACQGDSGGPIFCADTKYPSVQIGIVSWGKGCGEKEMPGVYTRVDMFLDWIEMILTQKGERPKVSWSKSIMLAAVLALRKLLN